MKTLVCLTLAACALAGPLTDFAQSAPAPLTRAQVRAELLRLEQAGYNPSAGDEGDYPADILAAEAKVAAEDAQRLAAGSVGGTGQTGSSQAGASTSPPAGNSPDGSRVPKQRMPSLVGAPAASAAEEIGRGGSPRLHDRARDPWKT